MPRLAVGIATIVCTLCMHGAINIADDYFDYANGVDTADSVYRSYVDKTEHTSLTWHMKCFLWLTILSVLLGAYLTYQVGPVIMAIGIVCIAVTYFYSGGPKPLANMAFGEFLSFLFFGPVACAGTYYAQRRDISNIRLLDSISIGLLVSCLMLANNIRDIETDKKASKITISVRIGEKSSKIMYIAFVAFAYAIPICLGKPKVIFALPFTTLLVKNLLARDKHGMQQLMLQTTLFIPLFVFLLML
jgi:1,4-dihydroxy-2-naphthoate octaprenyltransferase